MCVCVCVCVCLPEARTRDVMKEFGGVYEQQYAVALFNSVRYEIEGGGGPQSQLLHRKASASISSNRGLQTCSGTWNKLCKTNVQTSAGLTLMYQPFLHICIFHPKRNNIASKSQKCFNILFLLFLKMPIYLAANCYQDYDLSYFICKWS